MILLAAMFERFTDKGRQVVVMVQDEARGFEHDYVGTEHLLLGLLYPQGGIADVTLARFGLTAEDVRVRIVATAGQGEGPRGGQIPFTAPAKKVLEIGLREMLELGHPDIGPEHLLLALLRGSEGVAVPVLNDAGIKMDAVRKAVFERAPRDPRAAAAYAVGRRRLGVTWLGRRRAAYRSQGSQPRSLLTTRSAVC
jgi:ATP-dependent Clp protease ATP-binding subunit ClpC